MVRTASTGADVDRDGDVPGPSRLGRSSRQSRRLILGLYNKLVKQHGSDFRDTRA